MPFLSLLNFFMTLERPLQELLTLLSGQGDVMILYEGFLFGLIVTRNPAVVLAI